MLCSVIIPLYNKAPYIGIALDSVFRQTYPLIEVIVIDDGSTDGSSDIVNAIHDARLRVIHQVNAGVSQARNRGINAAHGELIFFLDADDWYDRRYLETMVRMAHDYPDNSFFAANFKVVLDYQSEDWNSSTPISVQPELISNFYLRRRCSGPLFFTATVAVRRADLMGFQPCFPVNESLGEDQDLWFRLAERLQLIYCPVQLAAYRIQIDGSLCATQKLKALPPAFARLEQRAKQSPFPAQARYSALLLVADARISVARYLLTTGNRCAALIELSKSLRGIVLHRWWLTWLMCCFGSADSMKQWDHWRSSRAQKKSFERSEAN